MATETTQPSNSTENTVNMPSRVLMYFKNSWKELKNVRWPDRKATWSMIAAVIAFSAFFIIIITLLDIVFEWLFNLIIK